MADFHLQIVTPDAGKLDAEAQRLIVRTVTGDICIMAGHIDYTAPLAIGVAKVTMADGSTRCAACNHGVLSVRGGVVRVAATTWEWADEIDTARAAQARDKAEKMLSGIAREDKDYAKADARLRRALARINAAERGM